MRHRRAARLTAVGALATFAWCGAVPPCAPVAGAAPRVVASPRVVAAGSGAVPDVGASDAGKPRLVRSAGRVGAGTESPALSLRAVPGAAGVVGDRLVAIKRRSTSDRAVAAQLRAAPGARLDAAGPSASGRVVTVDVPQDGAAAALAAMRASGLYEAVDYDVERRASYTASPNDPYFVAPRQVCFDPATQNVSACRDGYLRTVDGAWGLKGAPGAGFTAAWARLDASTATVAPVAVIDTGLQTHPDLAGSNFMAGHDYVDGDSDVDPGSTGAAAYHGTAVAGLVAASTNNSEGIAAAAPDNRVLVYRAGNQSGSFADGAIVDAVLAAVAAGARVINCSFGGPSPSAVDRTAFQEAADAGVLVVAAAGNNAMGDDGSGAPANTPQYPANYPSVMSVGALESNGAPAAFSNYDAAVAIAAPGDDLAVPAVRTSGGRTTYYSPLAAGTSFAAPFVAAAAADVWRVNPELSAAQVRQILVSTAVDVNHDASEIDASGQDRAVARAACRVVGRDDCTGAGRLDVAAALAAAAATPTIDVARDLWATSVARPLSIPIRVKAGTTLSLDAALPPGLVFASGSASSYTISGSTTAAGSYRLPLTLRDAAGAVLLERVLTVRVTPGPLVAYSLTTDRPAYELDVSAIYVTAAGLDRYGNAIPDVDAGTVLRMADPSQCEWSDGEAPSHRVCTVLGTYSGDYGKAAAQVAVDVFDTTAAAFAPAVAGSARVGRTLTAVAPNWPGLSYEWRLGRGAGTATGAGSTWVVPAAAVGLPVRLRVTLAYKGLAVVRTSRAAGPVTPGPATAGLASRMSATASRATGRTSRTIVPAAGTVFGGGRLKLTWGSGKGRSLTRTVRGAAATVALPYVRPGRYRVRAVYSEAGQRVVLGEVRVTVGRYRPAVTVRARGRTVTVTVRRGPLRATGAVVLRLAGRVVRARLVAGGRVVVARGRFGPGAGRLRAAYRGSAWFKAARGAARVGVV
jgi:subtilisin family serine protease